ncbi:CocE/NonD family hydrolase [Siphonobacter sp. SORGH_AS_1065]|uniref:CocE/NonD family hydrolase n=1 Tax=Siphonobacter sp. SORGH_AS_1065 TaxID=3041795 RepID=UPI00277F9E63|nr:CocE/NonD family hydrolase [Siphonobacter sp. SORGH_AS_1065]MDQ1089317.1 putative CocE/NonD family hydrolase [Siphonobacter sp. SORGH_AS_1065]
MKHVFKTMVTVATSILLATTATDSFAQIPGNLREDSLYIRKNYSKLERLIPMRDGVKLFTSIYVPKDESKKYPIMLDRTPYSVAPYGEDKYKMSLGPSMLFAKEGYIIVYQDVRGKYMSEGEFVAVKPFIPNKTKKTDVDESSDTYDTIEWLLKNLPTNNGKVGTWGISAPGFYTTMTAIEAHPALKAASPQAPVTDWFMGDDRHHNGAFFLMGTFSFLSSYGAPRPEPTTQTAPQFSNFGTPDSYEFYKNIGPIKNINEKILKGENVIWNQMMENESYNEFWKSRTPVPHLKNITPAILTVGGWFDQEDLYGPLKTFAGIEKNSPKTSNFLVMGPWIHGGWSRVKGDVLGNIRFDSDTGPFYRENIELAFFNHHLKGEKDPQLPKAYIFETGSNVWKKYDAWPPKQSQEKNLYFHANGKLSFEAPKATPTSFMEYLSDPSKSVPFTSEIRNVRGADFMYEDQRFAATRPDVLVYESDVLAEDVIISGNVMADLFVSTTGTDADFVVKLIDVYPGDAPNNSPIPGTKMGGFQLMVRGEVMRSKFRKSFSKPEAMVPNKVEEVKFDMQDAAHCFKKGHKIMVQVQSSWFPLVDRNPQKFVNIYKASESDFQKAMHKVYSTPSQPSHVKVRVVK